MRNNPQSRKRDREVNRAIKGGQRRQETMQLQEIASQAIGKIDVERGDALVQGGAAAENLSDNQRENFEYSVGDVKAESPFASLASLKL